MSFKKAKIVRNISRFYCKLEDKEIGNKKESISKEFSDLNKEQNDYGYYDTDFKGGVRKYKRKTTRKNRRKSKKSKKSKRKNKNTRKR